MLAFPSSIQAFICLQPTDMLRSFDTLAAMTVSIIREDPLSGHLFVFLNRDRNRAKILFWDRTGYCLYYKRLEAGTFMIPARYGKEVVSMGISLPDLMLILEGIDLSGARRRKRFSLENVL